MPQGLFTPDRKNISLHQNEISIYNVSDRKHEMNKSDLKYSKFGLVKDMLDTCDVLKALDIERICSFGCPSDKVLLTGEGSSRIFPAKNTACNSHIHNYRQHIISEGGRQSCDYNLDGYSVFISSNSGKTAEIVSLLRSGNLEKAAGVTGIAAFDGTPVTDETNESYVLSCGKENAVAATKSVIEQALFYDVLFRQLNGVPLPDRTELSEKLEQCLTLDIAEELTQKLAGADVIYFAGRNNGVAEELVLKTNEIVRRKAMFLEGTYAVHGIEEVMNPGEVVVLIDPFPEEEEKIKTTLEKGVGMTVAAIASRDTLFPTVKIPSYDGFDTYLQLCTGWNLLVDAGIKLGVDLDHPLRARKVGNEFRGKEE